MELLNDLRKFIQEGNLGFFSRSQFCGKAATIFGVTEEIVGECLDKLEQEGFIATKNDKYTIATALGYMVGDMQMTLRGYGFVDVADRKDDIFVARDDLNGAIDGDRVLVSLKPNAKRTEGYVVKILERRVQNVVGTVMQSKSSVFLIPDDERLGQSLDVRLTKAQQGKQPWKIGDKVVARFDGNSVYITEVLGNALTVGVDILSIIRQYNLYEEFPSRVVGEAKKVSVEPDDEEIKRRTDLRDKYIITIDPADAKDLDDAISLEELEGGMVELGVHIADVAHYVQKDSELDTEAFKRGTSVYFPNMVLPMLPKVLSNDMCSLHEKAPRLALSVFMTMDKFGEVIQSKIVESIIEVKKRYSYEEAQKELDEGKNELLNKAAELTRALENMRRARGEVLFDVPEPKIILDEKTGKIVDVKAYPRYMSHRIIESFMVLCNETVAKKMSDMDLPFVYRIHEKPSPEKVAKLIETLKPFRIEHKLNPEYATGHAYANMIMGLEEDIRPIVSQLSLRSMQKAKYSPSCLGHFGLGAKYYCHFTSPIRRYPDLIIHRIIKLMLNRKLNSHRIEEYKDLVEDASEQSSKTELTATEAEREVDNLKRAEYMHDHIGDSFEGRISGIQDFGVFVYIPSNTVEGLIKMENMPTDKYTFNEKQMVLVGTKRSYKMGDKIDVIVAGVNIPRRQVEFSCKKN